MFVTVLFSNRDSLSILKWHLEMAEHTKGEMKLSSSAVESIREISVVCWQAAPGFEGVGSFSLWLGTPSAADVPGMLLTQKKHHHGRAAGWRKVSSWKGPVTWAMNFLKVFAEVSIPNPSMSFQNLNVGLLNWSTSRKGSLAACFLLSVFALAVGNNAVCPPSPRPYIIFPKHSVSFFLVAATQTLLGFWNCIIVVLCSKVLSESSGTEFPNRPSTGCIRTIWEFVNIVTCSPTIIPIQ